MFSDLPFRKNVSILLLNPHKQLLLGERFRQKGVWQFPQGGVEDNDGLEETVYREIEEELGVKRQSVSIIKQLNATNQYVWEVIPKHFAGKYRGQDQTFWLVQYLDLIDAFDLQCATPQEFRQIKWVDIDAVLSIVEPVRVEGYAKAVAEVKAYLAENEQGGNIK